MRNSIFLHWLAQNYSYLRMSNHSTDIKALAQQSVKTRLSPMIWPDLTMMQLKHILNCWCILIGKINSTSRLSDEAGKNKKKYTEHWGSACCSGGVYVIFLACTDIYSRLGTPRCMDIHELPSDSYSGYNNSIIHRGTDKALAVRLCCGSAATKLASTKPVWPNHPGGTESGTMIIPGSVKNHLHVLQQDTEPLCATVSHFYVNIIQLSTSSYPIQLVNKLAEGERLLRRSNCRKMEDARHEQRVKPLLTCLRQQVLRESILIPASEPQLTTEQLCKKGESVQTQYTDSKQFQSQTHWHKRLGGLSVSN